MTLHSILGCQTQSENEARYRRYLCNSPPPENLFSAESIKIEKKEIQLIPNRFQEQYLQDFSKNGVRTLDHTELEFFDFQEKNEQFSDAALLIIACSTVTSPIISNTNYDKILETSFNVLTLNGAYFQEEKSLYLFTAGLTAKENPSTPIALVLRGNYEINNLYLEWHSAE